MPRDISKADPSKMRFGYMISWFLIHWIFRIYFRGRVFGRENMPKTGPALMACNHQSFLDPVMIAQPFFREFWFVARDSLFRNKIFGGYIRWNNAFPIKRGKGDTTAFKMIIRLLKRGFPVIIFPEGTRTRDGSLLPMNPNSFEVAKRAKAPIVPVLIYGAYEAYPRGAAIPRPRRISLTYLKPLSVEDVAALSTEQIAKHIDVALAKAMESLSRGERPI